MAFPTSKAVLQTLLTKVNGSSLITLATETLMPHPADIKAMDRWVKDGNDLDDYKPLYESFEIRSGSERTFANIVFGSLDLTNANYMKFEMDIDLNETIMNYGNPHGRVYEGSTGNVKIRRVVTMKYSWVISIEYTKFVDTAEEMNRGNVPFDTIKRIITE